MFIRSCDYDYPAHSKPEIALVGRSNAGKSSFLNSLSGRKVARVSKVPGKTTLLNFFDLKDYILVDMPGYGYAKRSFTEIKKWKNMVENYFQDRSQLKLMLLIMDVRRDLTDDENMLIKLAEAKEIPIYIVLNKIDKFKDAKKKINTIKNASGIDDVFLCSSKTKEGIVELKVRLARLETR